MPAIIWQRLPYPHFKHQNANTPARILTGSNWLKPAPDESWSFLRSNRLEVLGGGAAGSSGSGTYKESEEYYT